MRERHVEHGGGRGRYGKGGRERERERERREKSHSSSSSHYSPVNEAEVQALNKAYKTISAHTGGKDIDVHCLAKAMEGWIEREESERERGRERERERDSSLGFPRRSLSSDHSALRH